MLEFSWIDSSYTKIVWNISDKVKLTQLAMKPTHWKFIIGEQWTVNSKRWTVSGNEVDSENQLGSFNKFDLMCKLVLSE